MAIVKLKYTRSRNAIKRHLRYIVHRPGKEREKLTRQLFTHNYESVAKQRVYDRIDASARNTLFYKLIINLDPQKEDTHKDLDLQHLTSHTIREMERRIGRDVLFVATIHNDHTPLRHIHGIALVQGRIAKEDFAKLKTLWQSATQEARAQRRLRDRTREHRRTRFLTQAQMLYQHAPTQQRYRGVKPLRIQHGCFHCGYGQFSGIPSYRLYCPSCHKPLNQEKTKHLELDIQR